MRIVIFGAGYVGLTLGVIAAESGNNVQLIETNVQKVQAINSGRSHFFETGINSKLENLLKKRFLSAHLNIDCSLANTNSEPTIYIITLGTPINDDFQTSLEPIFNVCEKISSIWQNEDLLILRSTVEIGTSNKILKKFPKITNLAFCPERTIEGMALEELKTLPQIVGYSNEFSRDMASNFFKSFCPTIIPVSTLKTAEAVKLAANTYRDFTFSFGNALALIGIELDFNPSEVIRAANESYSRSNIPKAGLVGGPCLEKDPHILCSNLGNSTPSQLITMSRKLNKNLGIFLTEKWLTEINSTDKESRFLILGAAFKGYPLTDDIRGSLTLEVVDYLISRGVLSSNIDIIDPLVKEIPQKCNIGTSLADFSMNEYFGLIVCTNHIKWSEPEYLSYLKEFPGPVLNFWESTTPPKNNQDIFLGGYINE